MTVFKTFLNIVKKQKGVILLYTILLIVFGGINMQSKGHNMTFVDVKPDLAIVNEGSKEGLTKHLIQYLEENSNLISIKDTDSARKDALFYREVNMIIYLPKNYREDLLNGKQPSITIEKTGDYQSSLAETLLSNYLQAQQEILLITQKEDEIISLMDQQFKHSTNVQVTSKIDSTKLSNLTNYFNFASYSIMAAVIFVLCFVLSSFHETKIHKRITVSSMNVQTHNKKLLFSSFVYAFSVWLLFLLLGFILLKDSIFSIYGVIASLNCFLFTLSSLTLALLISTLITDKNALSGIVNVVALGSAFLCGAFVPAEWLPESVLKIAHILPTYWYINTNNRLKEIELFTFSTIKPLLFNGFMLLLFSILFFILMNIVSKKKRVF